MRKLLTLVCTAVLAALAVGCEEEIALDAGDGILIGAQIDSEPTKASFDGDSGEFGWSVGDHIALWNDGAYAKARLAKIIGKVGYFALPLSSTSRDHYALYPFDILDEGHYGVDPEGLWINYPDSYFVENSESGWRDSVAVFSPTPMVAVNREGQMLHFKHVGAVIRLTLKNIPANTRIITFRTGEKISGKFRVIDPSSDAPYVKLDDDIASGRGDFVRIHFRQVTSGEVTLNIPLPPGNYSMLRVTTHSDYNTAASGWGAADLHRTLSRADARKVTIDLDNSSAHLYSFTPSATDITIIKDLTAVLPYEAFKTASDPVEDGDGLVLDCVTSDPSVAVPVISSDPVPVLRVKALSEGTTQFTLKATLGGQTQYAHVKVTVKSITGVRMEITGLPNMLNGRDRQTLVPTVWTDPPSSKELDYEWSYTWESDNGASATVDADGLVQAGSKDGKAVISCKTTILGVEYGTTYGVNVVTNPPGTLPGVFTFDEYGHYCFFAKSNLVYWKAADPNDGYYEAYDRKDPLWSLRNGIFALAENQYDYYTGRVYSGNVNYRRVDNYATPGFDKFHFLVPQVFFPNSGSTQRIYDLDYDAANHDPKEWYNQTTHVVEFPVEEDLGTGWYAPSYGQWNYILFSRRASTIGETRHSRFVRVIVKNVPALVSGYTHVRGILIFPDIYEHPATVPELVRINGRNAVDTYSYSGYLNYYTQITPAQLEELEALGCVFLSACGWYAGESEVAGSDMTVNTNAIRDRNSGGWYMDNQLYQNNQITTIRFYTTNGGSFGYSNNEWADNTKNPWDYRFAIRLIRGDDVAVHDYNRDDPENW